MKQTTVVVIGGGATGVGILRDLAMRGMKAVLLEQRDLAYGTSSRFHGLLHSGARYAVKDAESARECIQENAILRQVAKHCVEATEGLFVRLPEDDDSFEQRWLQGCSEAGITTVPLALQEAWELEPAISRQAVAAYRVPDSAIDGFRLVWQNVLSARRYGAEIHTYCQVTAIRQVNGRVVGVCFKNVRTGNDDSIACDYVVNAAGSWVGHVAGLAGIDVSVKPDRGVLVAFNHRISSRVINRLRPPSDGDIFVPHGSITILGTTSSPAQSPTDTIPHTSEVIQLLQIGNKMFPELGQYRILRAFAGTRPLYSTNSAEGGRAASRNFTILDHSQDGLEGFASIAGGKLTTYRLMAEKMVDFVCRKLTIEATCRTAKEPLVEEASPDLMSKARRYFPAYGTQQAVSRLGPKLAEVVKRMEDDPAQKQLVCECELVTLAEVEAAAADKTSFTLGDIRRKTRMGMGTCQGAFCSFRGLGTVTANHLVADQDVKEMLLEFLQARWNGIRPILWGGQLREVELIRGIYDATLNINGVMPDENL